MKKTNTKIRVGILSGGPSPEYEVSLVTAGQVKKNLDKSKYIAIPIRVSKTGQWPKGLSPEKLSSKIDVAFIAMHGYYGEDGIVQSLLEANNIPYTGSGILASALAMDKWRSSLVAQAVGIRTPFTILPSKDNIDLSGFGKMVVVKPNTGGSSVGVKMIAKSQLKTELRKSKTPLLVQELISGREFTVSVLGADHPRALPVIEILHKAKFYDYHAKYSAGGSEHIVPAKISDKLREELQAAAVSMHIASGCRGASRSDFLMSADRKLYYLETNTIPGMTPTSLLPQAAQAAGISFTALLDLLIVGAL